jgi:pantoate--beta-alanine ligase
LSESVVVSIFVNPTQFNQKEDLERYPRDETRDIKLLEKERVTAVFIPDVDEIYPTGAPTWISVEGVAEPLEGAFRPGHFRGVATVVAKLFQIVRPHVAIFGEKDFQQLRVIEDMTKSLFFPISIIRAKIVREPDGLAMSSRNVRLSEKERATALSLSMGLREAERMFNQGERDSNAIREKVRKIVTDAGVDSLDYVEIIDEITLQPISTPQVGSRVCIAAWIGGVRLIDNIGLGD